MSLASEIISVLSSEQCDITTALLKARVLASRLSNKPLATWCMNELSGYAVDAEIPSYRKLEVEVQATIVGGGRTVTRAALPIFHLEDQMRQRLTEATIREGISSVQAWAGKKDIVFPYPVDLGGLFASVLQPNCVIERLYGRPSHGAWDQILIQVRTRLLEFVLELKEALPSEEAFQNPVSGEMKNRMDTIFQNVVMGDNSVIQFGDHNVAKINSGVIPGDLVSLLSELKRSGLSDLDAEALKVAIDEDGAVPGTSKELGPKVKGWMGAVLSKAAMGTWKIASTVAANLVTAALSAFYGFPVR
ncbi:TPA: hypothetical protein ACOFD1_000443 [Stenotrophomonas maltophilia]